MAGGKSRPKYKEGNLVSLVWPVNSCHSTLVDGIPENVRVDLDAGTWRTPAGIPHEIGQGIHDRPIAGYPIGVYDRTKMKHLERMKDDIEWVKSRNSCHCMDVD